MGLRSLDFITALKCEICLEEFFHVPVEVDSPVMDFFMASGADYPYIIQGVLPAIFDRDDVVDFELFIVAKPFNAA